MSRPQEPAGSSRQAAPVDEWPRFDGRLSLDAATRNEYARDYGQIVHRRPAAVLHPGSVEDIARIVEFARRSGLKVAVRGHGHQPFGQAQISAGVVIDMRSVHSVHSLTGDSIEVDAGADWRSVLRATLYNGLAPPVLTNYLGLTVGGTLSIGGVGMTTLRHGAQVDQTQAVQIVTGRAEIVSCSESEHRELFDTALAGQGQYGVITRAVLRLERAPTAVREYALRYENLQMLIDDSVRVSGEDRFDGAVGMIVPAGGGWSYMLNAFRSFTSPAAPDDAALLADLQFTRGLEHVRTVAYSEYVDATPRFDPSQSHADLGLYVPGSNVAQFVAETLPRLRREDLGTVAAIRMFVWRRARFRRPLLRLPDDEHVCYLALLRSETSDRAEIARMLSGNRALFEHNRSIGGALYPFAALEMTHSDWRRHYGPLWPALIRAKRRYDPDHVFQSGADLGCISPMISA